MQVNNVQDKYAVAIFQKGKKKAIGHPPLQRLESLQRLLFTF